MWHLNTYIHCTMLKKIKPVSAKHCHLFMVNTHIFKFMITITLLHTACWMLNTVLRKTFFGYWVMALMDDNGRCYQFLLVFTLKIHTNCMCVCESVIYVHKDNQALICSWEANLRTLLRKYHACSDSSSNVWNCVRNGLGSLTFQSLWRSVYCSTSISIHSDFYGYKLFILGFNMPLA